MLRRIVVSAEQPDPVLLAEAADAIRAGAVVAIPTDTLYGLAVDPFRRDAVARVVEVKGRTADRAMALIAADAEQVADRLGALPPLARALAAEFWPGPLTLLIASIPTLAPSIGSEDGKVGVRVPANVVARRLCACSRTPLTATSANISGAPPSNDPEDIVRALGDRIDVLLDAGLTPGGPPSTIVDATGAAPVLVRAGAIAWDVILSVCG